MVTILARAVSDKNRGAFATGQLAVAAAGTGENLTAQVIPDGYKVVLKAKSTNGGVIYIGNSKANAESATTAFRLLASQAITLQINNLNLVWVNSSVTSEVIEWAVET